MNDDLKMVLHNIVYMANWTHNMNVMVSGYIPMQLMTGKIMVLPSITQGNMATESLFEDEGDRKIMVRHNEISKNYREQEFGRK